MRVANPSLRLHLLLTLTAFPIAAAASRGAHAQLPGLPTLQNAFGNSGIGFGLNGGSGAGVQAYALAAGYGRERFTLGGGIGSSEAPGGNGLAFGLRLAVPIRTFASGRIGVAGFAGLGGATAKDTSVAQVPVGVAVGWRRALGATRGISVYAAPHYGWFRRTQKDSAATSAGRFRVSAGVDVGITERLGATLGVEAGQRGIGRAAAPGRAAWPAGTIVGLGVTWLWRRGG